MPGEPWPDGAAPIEQWAEGGGSGRRRWGSRRILCCREEAVESGEGAGKESAVDGEDGGAGRGRALETEGDGSSEVRPLAAEVEGGGAAAESTAGGVAPRCCGRPAESEAAAVPSQPAAARIRPAPVDLGRGGGARRESERVGEEKGGGLFRIAGLR